MCYPVHGLAIRDGRPDPAVLDRSVAHVGPRVGGYVTEAGVGVTEFKAVNPEHTQPERGADEYRIPGHGDRKLPLDQHR